jgi:L-threonylcarbamoyladenylate synthase
VTATILSADDAGIAQAAGLICAGEVVAFPTETLYGLAVDALDEAALARLVQLKGWVAEHPISLIVADEAMLQRVVTAVPSAARRLMGEHWPGPLTLVLPAADGLPAVLVNPRGGVGLRVSSDPVARALVQAVGRPITATSANRSGQPAATDAGLAAREAVSLVLDGGVRETSASTVVEVLDRPVLLRQGAVELGALR